MGGDWSPFISPVDYDLSLPQLGFLTAVYGYVLFQASNLISDGSELLLFIPALQGIIGSVILPIFGAVPDSMMVLFSGLGNRQDLQREVSVGVGTLAGSTIMLLTLPWCLAVVSGRVTINQDGTPNYRRPKGEPAAGWQKLSPQGNWSLTRTGIQGSLELKTNALLMVATMTTYFFIQVPAFFDDKSNWSYNKQGEKENKWALVAFILSGAWFAVYLYRQYRDSRSETQDPKGSSGLSVDMEVYHMLHLIDEGKFTLFDAIKQFRQDAQRETGRRMSKVLPPLPLEGSSTSLEEQLLEKRVSEYPKKSLLRMKLLLRHLFHKYETNDKNEIDERDFHLMCQDMGIKTTLEVEKRLFQDADMDKSGSISLKEFTSTVIDYARHHGDDEVLTRNKAGQPRLPTHRSISQIHSMVHSLHEDDAASQGSQGSQGPQSPQGSRQGSKSSGSAETESDEESEGSEEDSPPEDLQDDDPKRQQLWILLRSFKLMLSGTLLVLIFSDPMVDVLAEIGTKLDMSPFYVSFVIAPIASNASELVAAYNYARKRTERSITVSISTLQGAACMNNTFCLCVFMGLMYFRQLAWQYSAECLAILAVEVILAVYSYFKRVQTLLDAVLIALLYPASLLFVWYLKNPDFVGMD